MSYNLILTSMAHRDLSQALKYYAKISPVLSERFLQHTKAAFTDLETHPHFYSYFGDGKRLRNHTIKKFPYTIVFEIKLTEVFVVGIYNMHQNRDVGLNRL